MKKIALSILFAAAIGIGVAQDSSSKNCDCRCRKCPPQATLVKKGGTPQYKGCFRDNDRNGICDTSVRGGRGGKCGSNCEAIPADKKADAQKRTPNPCANCPCAANCSACFIKKP